MIKRKIDYEWDDFLLSKNNDNIEENDDDDINPCTDVNDLNIHFDKLNIDDEDDDVQEKRDIVPVPTCSDIYISTKTKIAYLNQEIDLKRIFWNIKIIPYSIPEEGVIKKQMKFNSLLVEEYDEIQEHLKKENYYEEYIITHIDNPTGRIKFKDIRKISVGISKKDLLSYRCKKKSAFYNCFVVIFRFKIKDIFREFHVKVFNTGKLETPGVQNDEHFNIILENVIKLLQPYCLQPLDYRRESTETVLINSNFNCGFLIKREILLDILEKQYRIQCIYDPCSYPGIQCKYFYNDEKDGRQLEVSFMIFRTGSVLISGKCNENILYKIYNFLKDIFIKEYVKIYDGDINQVIGQKDKKKKTRKKLITVNNIE